MQTSAEVVAVVGLRLAAILNQLKVEDCRCVGCGGLLANLTDLQRLLGEPGTSLKRTKRKWETVPCSLKNARDAEEKEDCVRELQKNMFIVVNHGYYYVFPEFKEAGADFNARQEKDMTPLHISADMGFVENVKMLIHNISVDINAKSHCERTALHMAASKGFIKAVEELLKGGADTSIRDCNGLTAEEEARKRGLLQVADALAGKKV
ncbi:cyclin-dependent kinase 4 inhibitor D-like [Periplaneta americana]|uniref:cyclin-dependent kinase 4 inhibitor D-like n=1 Tax=Periplaneta americana TaxID=6978 RepID=UPI0037E7D424